MVGLRALAAATLLLQLLRLPLAAAAPPPPQQQQPAAACDARGDGWEGEFFPGIGPIRFEGPASANPLSFRHFNASEEVLGRPMKSWLRFSLAFWHTMHSAGADPFGAPTRRWPWEEGPGLDAAALAHRRLRAFFELVRKLGVEWWAFHDRDIAPEGPTLAASNALLGELAAAAAGLQAAAGARPLWGTAQLFKHPRYLHGAATAPNASVFAYAAAQVKKAMDVTAELGGQNFVFWGGREGYTSLLTTDMGLEQRNAAALLRMALRYKRDIGFEGPLLLEPKPKEPMHHQYDYDAATTLGFLAAHGLPVGGDAGVKLNIECNHATLAGHSCAHELEVAALAGALGSIDINTGDPQVGWDTDQFLTNPVEAMLVARAIIRQGGIAPGGLNFDAKLRRESTDPADLFFAHISGMDAMARGLRAAAALHADGTLDAMRAARYESWAGSELGRGVASGALGLPELERHALGQPDPWEEGLPSGAAELADVVVGRFV